MAEKTDLTVHNVYKLYDSFIRDNKIDELELGLSVPNIFEVLKITNKEIRHSNFLAWLLNPNGYHGLGDLFIKRFLRQLFSSDKAQGLDPVSVMETDLSKVRIKREWKYIDLLIELEKIVILIENKFYSKESKGQLSKYKKRVEKEFPKHKKVYAFLTPFGIESEAENEWYQEVSYQTIIDIIGKLLTVYGQNLHPSAEVYLNDYQTILKRELMSGDNLSELAQRIYYSHKELMDFIIENRPDVIDEVREILIQKLKEKGYRIGSENKYYARFYTDKISDLIYISKDHNGWKKRESFLFEIHITKNRLQIKTVLPPTDPEYDKEKVANLLKQTKGAKKPKGDKWLIHHSNNFSFNSDQLYEMSEEKIEKELEKFHATKIEPIVKKVEEAFEENREMLLKLKEDAENAES